MYVKFCFLIFLLLHQTNPQEAPEGVVIAQIYRNPYLNTLSALRTYCRSMFERMSTCVRYRLRNDSEAGGDIITQDCTGLQFEIVDKTFKQTLESSFTVFLKIFSQRLFMLRLDFGDEISHFISRFKFMVQKNFIMFSSMQTSLIRANYYVEKSKYLKLLEILEPELLLFSKFQNRLKNDKSELINEIEALLEQRDKDLKLRKKHELEENETDTDQDSSKKSSEETEKDLAEDLENEVAEIDSQIDALHSDDDEHRMNEALEHSLGEKIKEPNEKFVVYQEATFPQTGNHKSGAAAHAGHGDHRGGQAYPVTGQKGMPEIDVGYSLEDGQESPYTVMEKLKISEFGDFR